MNKLYSLFFYLLLSTIIIIFGCENSTNSNQTDTTSGNSTDTTNGGDNSINVNDLSIKNTNVKSLFASNIIANNGANKNVTTRSGESFAIQTLSYIDNLGQNVPFFFVTSSGKNVVLDILSLKQLDNKRIMGVFIPYYVTIEGNAYTIEGYTDKYSYFSGGPNNVDWSHSISVLIDMGKNKVYNLFNFKWTLFQINLHNGYSVVDNDLLFIMEVGGRTIYKIDLNNTYTAIPLNNGQYNPIYYIDPPIVFGNKIIGNHYSFDIGNKFYSFDIDNKFTLKNVVNACLTPEICSFQDQDETSNYWTDSYYAQYREITFYENSESNGFLIRDLQSSPWYLTFNSRFKSQSDGHYNYIGSYPYYNDNESYKTFNFIGKLSIDDDGKFSLSNYSTNENSFKISNNVNVNIFIFDAAKNARIKSYIDHYYNDGLLLAFENGFINIEKKIDKIDVTSVSLSLPTLNTKSCFINKNNYLYYIEGSSIKRLYLAAGESPSIIYTNSRLLSSVSGNVDILTASGTDLIFYQFAEDNITINTYSLDMYKANATPKLMASYSAEIKDIVEFDF